MTHEVFSLNKARTRVAGSIGGLEDLRSVEVHTIAAACDIVEIRLDLLAVPQGMPDAEDWRRFAGVPLLFTARRGDEGGRGDLSATERRGLLDAALEDAAMVDIEVASIHEMRDSLDSMRERGVPWIASFHDYGKLPETSVLEDAAHKALEAGASAFKAAAMLASAADIARLAEFQLADHGLPVATMGMGPLAPVSRLLCAQCGSVLNYGYLGETPTAPGQWDAALLKQAIARLVPFRV